MKGITRRLYLCGGLQGSGSTLVSWCFLQRSDMDGVLDADNDLLPFLDPRLGNPYAWYKTNVGSFRMSELVRHYGDLGWDVYPLLVVRDLRDLWASLVGEAYTANGITAEDPPLRMRLRRFAEDCRDFARTGWPIIKYETLIATPSPSPCTHCQPTGPALGQSHAPLAENASTDSRLPAGRPVVLEGSPRQPDLHRRAATSSRANRSRSRPSTWNGWNASSATSTS